MNPLSIIGLFCEDIREEKGDVLTLVGLMPDNVNVEAVQREGKRAENMPFSVNRVLSKLCVYARANFDPHDPIQEIGLNLVLPNGQKISIGGAVPEFVERAKVEAKEKNSPLAGVIMRAVLVGFVLPEAGILRLEASIGAEMRLLAVLNFLIAETSTSIAVKK